MFANRVAQYVPECQARYQKKSRKKVIQVAHFGPELLAQFSPEWVAQFGPE